MKGQAISIDWSIGLGLFITALISAILLLGNSSFFNDRSDLEQKAFEVEEEVIREVTETAVKTELVSRTSSSISGVPVDQKYFYRNFTNLTGNGEQPAHFNSSDSRFVTVLDTGNRSYNITYSSLSVSSSHYSDLVSSGDWINNSNLSLKLKSSGLEALMLDDNKLLESDAEISLSTDVRETELFHETGEGNLTVYNNSKEFLVESENPVFNAANFSTLYWESDDTEYDLNQLGTVKEGDTQGFTVANSSIGMTFTGDLNAKVSRPDSSTVKIDIESNSTRVRLHEAGIDFGKKKIENEVNGDRYIQMERLVEATSEAELDNLENLSSEELENRLRIGQDGYNLSLTVENSTGSHDVLDRGENIPLTVTAVETFTLNILRKDGELQEVEGRVVLWQ